MKPTVPGSLLYTITLEERARGLRVGNERQEYHDKRGTPNAYGLSAERAYSLQINQLGALAELVIATLLGCEDEWVECTNDYQQLPGDVLPRVQVRSARKADGRLILHPRDKDDHAFVLCRHHMVKRERVVEVCGWLWAIEGKRDEWWPGKHPSRPCFMVPDDRLRPGLRGLQRALT